MCKRGHKNRTSQDKVQKDQDEPKMSGMDVMSCADNTSDKNLITTVKDLRGRLDRILATGSDVMCAP